jgi:predicted adenylyl cyclase CyaB
VPRNVEVKAFLADPETTRRLVAEAADGPPETLDQTDTFFRAGTGRLKLRELGSGRAELIHYSRPDTPDPAESRFERAAVGDAPALRALLSSALGVAGTVRKRRLLYHVGRTRVHLDDVRDLGWFLELEVQMAEGEPAAAGALEAEGLLRRFAVPPEALVAEAYVDLLRRRDGGDGGDGEA